MLLFTNSDQLEDLPSKQSNKITVSGYFEGIVMEKTPDSTGSGQLTFLFSQIPQNGLTFFNFYDSMNRELIIDFYDSFLGESIVDTITALPFTKIRCQHSIIDLNAGVEGFAPDIRDVVRIHLACNFNLLITLEQNDLGLVDLYWQWNYKIWQSFIPKQKTYWYIPTLMTMMGITSYFVFHDLH